MSASQFRWQPGRLLHHRMAWWNVPVLDAGAAAVTWMVSSVFDTRGPDRVIGPYRVPVNVEFATGVVAVVSSVFILLALDGPRERPNRGATVGATVMIVVACVAAASWWRVATAMGQGANIGGGFVVLIGPTLAAAIGQGAVSIERRARNGHLDHAVAMSVCIWLAAFGATMTTWFLA